MGTQPLESELKIPVTDLQPVREVLRRERAVLVQASAREVNLLLDTVDGSVRSTGGVLRLRRYGGRTILTYKGPAAYRGPIKERPEHETEVGDLAAIRKILEQLGLAVVTRYEKDREEWRFGEVAVALDHTPMGDFVEIEGPPDRLTAVADVLGLETQEAVRESYVELWLDYRSRHPELNLPEDMVFTE